MPTPIVVTSLAQAGQSGKLHPTYIPSFWYPQGYPVPIWPPDFVDDTTAAQLAELLGGTVVKLQPRTMWFNGVPNSCPWPNLPLQNFVGFANQPNAPVQNGVTAMLVVNCGDLVNQACQGYSIGIQSPLGNELAIAYIILGSTTSAAAAAAYLTSPMVEWPASGAPGPYWYFPPVQATAPATA